MTDSESTILPVALAQPRPEDSNRSGGPAAPPRLVRETALEGVRQAIISGNLRPGSRLTEKSLCEQFGVSRTLAREIVRKLETERLIDVIPYRGLRIATLSPQVVQEIYAIRAELEVLVVKAFIATAKDVDIAALKDIHATLVAAATRRETRDIVTQVTRFLQFMVDASASKVAGELLDNLLARINMLRVFAMAIPGQLETSVILMDEIVESIARRDPDAAEAGVRQYVQTACRSALRHVNENAARK